jgi:hypothetical protein
MAELTVPIDVECQVCGTELDVVVTLNSTIQVEPCTKCLRVERQVGYDEGLSDGEYE